MTSLLSLPDELLLEILHLAFEEHQPLRKTNTVVKELCIDRRLRALAMQALARSLHVDVDASGVVECRLMRWMTAHDLWGHVRDLDLSIWIRGPLRGTADSLVIPASALPAKPTNVKLVLDLSPEIQGSIAWSTLLPFANESVSSIELQGKEQLLCDLGSLLSTFPRLVNLSFKGAKLKGAASQASVYLNLRRYREIGTFSSQGPCQHRFLRHCPNLLAADVKACQALGLQGLPAGVEELAVALDCIDDEAQDYRQFEGLERFRFLRKLAYRSLAFETGRQPEQCARALSQIPASVQHLAFDNVLIPTFLDELAPFLQNRQWLPNLKTLSVATAADEQMVRRDVEEACASRQINYRAFDVYEDYDDVPTWNDSPWF